MQARSKQTISTYFLLSLKHDVSEYVYMSLWKSECTDDRNNGNGHNCVTPPTFFGNVNI